MIKRITRNFAKKYFRLDINFKNQEKEAFKEVLGEFDEKIRDYEEEGKVLLWLESPEKSSCEILFESEN